tara:strand:- start:178 stop:597 length:420 start_codon:yes stop_codon:yes gene_type:complete
MKSSDMFYATSAVILLISMAYFSVQTEVIEKISTVVKWEDSVVIIDTVTVVETEIDTIFEYKTYRDDIVMNGESMIMSKKYLFHLSEDTMIGNQIRNVMPFGEVFNYWRDILGPCGVFDWKGDTYITLYKEEELQLCQQ